VQRWLDADVLPLIGSLHVAAVTAPMVTALGQGIVKRGAVETAHRVLQVIGQVLQFAEGFGLVERDASKASRAVLPPAMHGKFPAVVEPMRLGELLRSIDAFKGSMIVRHALQCLPYLAARPGNLRMMEWEELDLDAAFWTIPAAKLKRGVNEKRAGAPFKVPLPAQVVAILRGLQPLTGARKHVFPGVRGEARPISDGTLSAALMACGVPRDEHVPHGFRATFRTLAVERLDVPVHVAEAALAHVSSEELGASYDRATFLPARTEAMNKWADYLDKLKAGADVIPLRSGTA
jgi:integrase